jgi:hypothetical protein
MEQWRQQQVARMFCQPGLCKHIKQRLIPIPPATATAADKARVSQSAEACTAAAQRGDDATLGVHEAEIGQMVFHLFELPLAGSPSSNLLPLFTSPSAPKRKRGHNTTD